MVPLMIPSPQATAHAQMRADLYFLAGAISFIFALLVFAAGLVNGFSLIVIAGALMVLAFALVWRALDERSRE